MAVNLNSNAAGSVVFPQAQGKVDLNKVFIRNSETLALDHDAAQSNQDAARKASPHGGVQPYENGLYENFQDAVRAQQKNPEPAGNSAAAKPVNKKNSAVQPTPEKAPSTAR